MCKCPARATYIVVALYDFARTPSPEPGLSAGHAKSRAQTRLCTRYSKRLIFTPSCSRFSLSEGRRTRRTNALLQAGLPQPSFASGAGPTLSQKG